jgi:micrococcal nuclease
MSVLEIIMAIGSVVMALLWPHHAVVPAPTTETATVLAVIDGDTIVVRLAEQEETVRYIGIDTPEPRRAGDPECGSTEATNYNRDLVANKDVRLLSDQENRDRFGRLLRYVYVVDSTGAERFVNAALVEAGVATPLTIAPNTKHEQLFADLAATAERDQVGNWLLCPK